MVSKQRLNFGMEMECCCCEQPISNEKIIFTAISLDAHNNNIRFPSQNSASVSKSWLDPSRAVMTPPSQKQSGELRSESNKEEEDDTKLPLGMDELKTMPSPASWTNSWTTTPLLIEPGQRTVLLDVAFVHIIKKIIVPRDLPEPEKCNDAALLVDVNDLALLVDGNDDAALLRYKTASWHSSRTSAHCASC